jgi:hypothetical protein
MGHSEYDPAARERRAWNAGRIVGAKRALKPQQVWAIRFWLDHERRLRDRALFDLGIDSKLRGCDVVKVRIGDIVSGGRIRTRAIVVQQKTGRPVQFELLEAARTSILAWLEQRGGTLDDYAFPEPDRSHRPPEHEAVCPIGRRVGHRDRTASGGLRHALAAADQGVDNLQSNRQSAGGPNSARPHQDREYGPLSRRRRRGRASLGGKHGRVEVEPAHPLGVKPAQTTNLRQPRSFNGAARVLRSRHAGKSNR